MPEFHAEAPQATASEGLAQDPYVAARTEFETTTLRSKGVDSTNASPRPTITLDTCVQLTQYTTTRTTMAQAIAFATIGPSVWNAHPPTLLLTVLSGYLPASLSLLEILFYSLGFTLGLVALSSNHNRSIQKTY